MDDIVPPSAPPAAPPATPPAPPATPSLPSSVTLPGEPAAPAAPAQNTEEARAGDWDSFIAPGTPAERKPPVSTPPLPPPAQPATPPPAVPPATPPPTPKPPEPLKVPDAKPPEAKPPESEELPDDIMEGLGDAIPTNARDSVQRQNKMGKRLRKAGDTIRELKAKLASGASAEGKFTPPPDYEAIKHRVTQLEAEHELKEKELNDTRDRLYAQDLSQRPEYQQHVTRPWKAVQDTVARICKTYGQDSADVWAAFRMEKPEERDGVFAEMLNAITNPLDQRRFIDAIEAVPQISAAQKLLETHSKEKLEAFRNADRERTERTRGDTVAKAVQAGAEHHRELRASMPFLYEVAGDTPEVKAYNDGMKEAVALSEQLTRKGVETLAPEIQGKMVHDAVTADYIRRYLGSVLQSHHARIEQLQATNTELETANKQLQSELDEYRGADGVRGGGGHVPGAVPGTSNMPTLQENTAAFASAFGWDKR